MATTKTKPIHLFVPFDKIERRAEDDALIVEGYCFVNEVVEGEGGIRIKRSAMEAATPDYMKFGAVREMHQPSAAGTALSAVWDEKGCRLRAEIVDPVAAKKCERNVYKGFSIGITPTVRRGNDVEALLWPENSLVDRPRDPDALILHRADGFDPDAEVEVTVLDDPASPVAAPEAAAAPDPAVTISTPATSLPPTSEAFPAAAAPDRDAAAGASSHTEEQRAALLAAGLPEGMLAGVEVVSAGGAGYSPTRGTVFDSSYTGDNPIPYPAPRETERALEASPSVVASAAAGASSPEPRGDASRLWAMLAADVPHEMPETERRALVVEHLLAYGVAEPIAADMAGRVDVMRAQTSDTVPVRENLEGKRKPRMYDECRGNDAAADLAYSIGDAHWALMDSIGSIIDSDEEDKQSLIGKSVTQYAAHLQEMCKAKAERGELAAEVGRLRRVEAPAGEKTPPAASAVETTPSAASETVSRSTDRDDVQRLETVTAELSRVQVVLEAEQTLRATAEAEVRRLEQMPLDKEKPPVRFPVALEREFRANQSEDGADDVTAIRRLYESAKKQAQKESDPRLQEAASKRVALFQMALHQLGDMKA